MIERVWTGLKDALIVCLMQLTQKERSLLIELLLSNVMITGASLQLQHDNHHDSIMGGAL